jgi:hypothetical protein
MAGRKQLLILFVLCLFTVISLEAAEPAFIQDSDALRVPYPGLSRLRVISPSILELEMINTKPADPDPVESWNFVDADGNFAAPDPTQFQVLVDGAPVSVQEIGFKRRPLYAPLAYRDLRVDNSLYLKLASSIQINQSVVVQNPDQTLWAPSTVFQAAMDPLRFSPAIHVNQEGYVPGFSKKAMVGLYLGSLGEMEISAGTYTLRNETTGLEVYQGTLVRRPDVGYTYEPTPYQSVFEADFSAFNTQGNYRLIVPGLGASMPFRIHRGIAMSFARAYALGLYHQRCGTSTSLPWTRFTHGVCHAAPVSVPLPSSAFGFTWDIISYYSSDYSDNPRHTAPPIQSPSTCLYPFQRTGQIDVSGGHHDAGDYSRYTINSAGLVHYLIFEADSLPGVAAFDNMGIPESGDGISDVLQEAKWEADFLARMQDTEGGFYFLVYPREREYEDDVLPDHGDPQVVWPKTTAVTAAAVGALAQAGSSPAFKLAYPAVAATYLQKAQLGWTFLTNAIALHGKDGAYQKITHYGNNFMHDDELAFAAASLYAATGNPVYHQKLMEWFDPSSPDTWRYGWWHLPEFYGAAVRCYAFAARSGRLTPGQLDPDYLAKCEAEILQAGDDNLLWAQQNAYGTSFPEETKRFFTAGFYFSSDQAFDMAVAYQVDPKPEYLEAMLSNMNYEGGCNPVNVSFIPGLGWKRQHEVVSQYAQNDRRVLPPSGVPIGQIREGSHALPMYGEELSALVFPFENVIPGPYPFYDRWSDSHNVYTEFVVLNQARGLGTVAFLAALSGYATQAWTATPIQLSTPNESHTGLPVLAQITSATPDLSDAKVVWETRNEWPSYGTNTFTFVPATYGTQWVEVEIQWPDGRRLFGTRELFATNDLPTVRLETPQPFMSEDGSSIATLLIRRQGPLNQDLTVYLYYGGVATVFDDFRTVDEGVPDAIYMPPGVDSVRLDFYAIDDNEPERTETADFYLLSDASYNIGYPDMVTLYVKDNDLGILSVQRNDDGSMSLAWTTEAGRSYRVLYKENLGERNWTPLSAPMQANSDTMNWTDTAANLVRQRFYLIQRLP